MTEVSAPSDKITQESAERRTSVSAHGRRQRVGRSSKFDCESVAGSRNSRRRRSGEGRGRGDGKTGGISSESLAAVTAGGESRRKAAGGGGQTGGREEGGIL